MTATRVKVLLRWDQQFDVSKWGLIVARSGGVTVGGAVVAWQTGGVHMLEGRDDLAALWDIRVHPGHQRVGIGRRLFAAAEEWARTRRCEILKVETQDVNVRACRFYAGQGCTLVRLIALLIHRCRKRRS